MLTGTYRAGVPEADGESLARTKQIVIALVLLLLLLNGYLLTYLLFIPFCDRRDAYARLDGRSILLHQSVV